jgi:hypothetical protein
MNEPEPFSADTVRLRNSASDLGSIPPALQGVRERAAAGVAATEPGWGNDEYADMFRQQIVPGVRSLDAALQGGEDFFGGVQANVLSTAGIVDSATEVNTETATHLQL